jgi:alkylation response protein AidB-like acyl-CoA dehydrogenase
MTTVNAGETERTGGGFLLREAAADEIFTPEDLSAEHLAIAKTAAEFFENEVAPKLEAVEHQEPGVAKGLVRKAAALGLTAIVIPEAYGGLEMDLISALAAAEPLARSGSFSLWHGAHTGIGTLPLLLFGNEDQKRRYLPKLASAEMLAAYCLSEPHAGSDALNIRTRADLSEDGTHYVLNGQKMWITNGGAADLYTVFAKIGGDQFTAFLVERGWPGVKPGGEERKMGIKGSSTTPLYLENVRVPKENVLGETGRGHVIAFNILNIGRFKLGIGCTGAAKSILAASLRYAKERTAFGKPIGEFGMIRYKLAEMALRLYAAESMTYRVAGLLNGGGAGLHMQLAEEFAAECSFVKVFASEMLDYVADEGVQIHGGYGYHQDYLVERAYRDARINRIFEGTNEINRMLATGMLLKRAQKGRLGLVDAVKRLQGEILSGTAAADDPVRNAKKIALFALGAAYQRFLNELEHQQEVLAAITDIAMNAFAMESCALRARRRGEGSLAREYTRLFLAESMETVESAAKAVIAACSEGDAMRTNLAILRRFTRIEPGDGFTLRRAIAGRLLEAGRYLA